MNEMTLGQKIRELRLSKQMTQKELAGSFITRNMLSQIENDSATPSMKTMEYLASELQKPIGYFLDKDHKEVNLSQLIARLIEQNDSGNYEGTVALLEAELKENPSWADNQMIMDLFISSHLHLTELLLTNGDAAGAKDVLKQVLAYEGQIGAMSDVYAYKIYDLLAESSSQLKELEDAKRYYNKGKDVINKIISGREVQSLYIQMMDGDIEDIGEQIDQIDTSGFDGYSLARFHMIAGTSMLRQGQCEPAITYLEKALLYYGEKDKSIIKSNLYEQLSKCYSEMEAYKKAYDYLQKAQESRP